MFQTMQLFLVAGLAASSSVLADDPNLSSQSPSTATVQEAYPLAGPGVDEDSLDIRIDFGSSAGTTLPREWNNLDNSSLTGLTTGLIDFNSGMATPVSIDGLGGQWRPFVGDDFAEFPEQDWFVQPAAQDGAGLLTGLAASFLLSGLPDGEYRIEVLSARTTFDYLNTFRVDGALADSTFLGTPVQTPWGSTSDGLTPGNWLIWESVEPDGGEIQLDLQADASTLGMINAMRISQVGGGCRADLDGDGELTIFDFLEFQNLFDSGDLLADFDGDGELTIFDFLAFQNEFDLGCE